MDRNWVRAQNLVAEDPGTVAAGDYDVEFILKRGQTLGGRFVDASGTGAPGFFLVAARIDDVNSRSQTTAGDDGRFEIRSLQPGPHRVTFWQKFGRPGILMQQAGVFEAGTEGIEIRVFSLEGTLIDAQGLRFKY